MFERFLHEFVEVLEVFGNGHFRVVFRFAVRIPGTFADNGQDRSLDRFHDRAVSDTGTVLKTLGKIADIDRFLAFDMLIETAEDTGSDNTAVTSCSHQQAFGKRLSDIGDRFGRTVQSVLQAVCECHGHICTGITIRDREYVQSVDLFLMIRQISAAAFQ